MPELHKPIAFRGNALADLRAFPETARREADDDHGAGRPGDTIRDASGAFRVIYVAKFADAIFVLHCFQKKSQKTSREDLALATQRYKDLLKDLKP